MNGASAHVVVVFNAVHCGHKQKRPLVEEHNVLQDRIDMCGRERLVLRVPAKLCDLLLVQQRRPSC